jgi:hypothetical protein
MIIDFIDGNNPSPDGSKRKLKGPLALSALIVVGALFLQNTLAANISLGSGAAIEFGQGVQVTAACSGSDTLTLTPYSSFVNSSGSGSYYLNSVTVSGIPSSCNGVDFNLSVYDSSTSTALPIFATSKSVAAIWNNAGTFQVGAGSIGSSVTSGSGTFTITFTTPIALASSVSRVTLQSTSHAAYVCATDLICNVGDISSSGGRIFYKSVTAFTETGTACASNCYYLEYAPLNWMGTNAEGPYNFFHTVGNTYLTFNIAGTLANLGSGYSNTAILITAGDTQGAASRAKAYSGPNGNTTGQWFVPSQNEMNALYDSSAKSLSSFPSNEYLTSVQATATTCRTINMDNRSNNTQNCSVNNPMRLRPIRAF